MDYHADEDSCMDPARASLVVTTRIEGTSGSLTEPDAGAKLDEKLITASLSVSTAYGKQLFRQFLGTIAVQGHCLYEMEVGRTYDVGGCNLGDIGAIPGASSKIFDRVGLTSGDAALIFSLRQMDDGSQGDNTNMVMTGINKYMGSILERSRPKVLDDSMEFVKTP